MINKDNKKTSNDYNKIIEKKVNTMKKGKQYYKNIESKNKENKE